ncbi:hypothetical protein QWY82_08340 [Simiduia curdlanivorans]|uniref:Uncharacterized protein n=1 Tax=Simiduia curdlanivorans TaxID=1492769 RepID=A0ABV8V8S3_9GAMM|nr:hypothetical protein [Simiduia curdlanivorans]MDN3638812.1 hypothetical protein [Simiduia curdlanivorans]
MHTQNVEKLSDAQPFEAYSTADLMASEDMNDDQATAVDGADEYGEILFPRAGFGRCRFNKLTPVSDGVGPYHVNNHIGFFNAPASFNLATAVDSFYRNFPRIFSPGNIATATAPSCRVAGDITIQFVLNELAGLVHDEWVSVDKKTNNFVATTLERQFWTRGDQMIDMGLGAIPSVGSLFANISADINRRHFLAGYRSWTVGRLPNGLHFVETAAFERYSHPAYQALEGPIGMRAKILETWTKLVENYVASIGATLVRHVPTGYSVNRGVAHRAQQHASAATLRANPWFTSVLSRHPGI